MYVFHPRAGAKYICKCVCASVYVSSEAGRLSFHNGFLSGADPSERNKLIMISKLFKMF